MKSKEFGVLIHLGNEAMVSPNDVADALEQVQYRLKHGITAGKILDVNGNTVGAFGFR